MHQRRGRVPYRRAVDEQTLRAGPIWELLVGSLDDEVFTALRDAAYPQRLWVSNLVISA